MQVGSTLYKRAANGAIRKWWVEVHTNVNGIDIQRVAGQLHGAMTSTWDYSVQGKNIGRANKTTPFDQAVSEAESYYKKQLDNGYKTLAQLDCIEEELDFALPIYNTDAQGNIKPMLAQAVKWEKVKYPVYVQPKLDGVRCLMVVKDGEVAFYSRSGKPYTTLGHIEVDVLNAINNKQAFVLDGEVYSDQITFQDIISAVKKQGPNSTLLKFRAYDMVNGLPQVERLSILLDMVNQISSDHVTYVETHEAFSKDTIIGMHNNWVEDGNEGAMIRNPNAKYKQGVRSADLLKVKEFNEAEFFVDDIIKGKRDEDLIAVCRTVNELTFKAKLTGSREYKFGLYLKWPGITPYLTVKYFGLTDDGIPRFPIGKAFRDYE